MNSLLHFLSSLFACLLFFSIVVAGLVMMVAPPLGKRLLKNIAIAAGIFILGYICLCAVCSPGFGMLMLLLASVTAYFIREGRGNRHERPVQRQNWAERTPVLPREEDET
jgi:hypothetical protein